MSRLLLVDDNPSIDRIVVSLLSGAPFEVTYAKTASEALGLVDGEAPFDLALLDTSLPEMDGWELLGRMRENPKAASIPIAMMVGVLEDVDRAKVDKAPIQALMLKPVDFRDFPDRLQGLIAAGVTARVAPAVPLASASFADADLLILEEQDLAEDEGLGGSGDSGDDAPPPALAAEPSSDGDAMFSLNLEDLNMGEIDKLAVDGGSVPFAEEEPFIPQPELEPQGTPVREDSTDFIDASPDDFDFGKTEEIVEPGTEEADAAPTLEAIGGDAMPDEPTVDLGEETEPSDIAQPESGRQQADSAVPEQVEVGAHGDVASLESELLSDTKFIEAVARAVTKAVVDKLSN